jgi:hypothetical protein
MIKFAAWIKMFLFSKTSSCGIHPASYRIGTGLLSLWVKHAMCESDHSNPLIAEIKFPETVKSKTLNSKRL